MICSENIWSKNEPPESDLRMFIIKNFPGETPADPWIMVYLRCTSRDSSHPTPHRIYVNSCFAPPPPPAPSKTISKHSPARLYPHVRAKLTTLYQSRLWLFSHWVSGQDFISENNISDSVCDVWDGKTTEGFMGGTL